MEGLNWLHKKEMIDKFISELAISHTSSIADRTGKKYLDILKDQLDLFVKDIECELRKQNEEREG